MPDGDPRSLVDPPGGGDHFDPSDQYKLPHLAKFRFAANYNLACSLKLPSVLSKHLENEAEVSAN